MMISADVITLNPIRQHAKDIGVSDAKIIKTEVISVEERFSKLCGDRKCDGFNTSINCPPHVMKPAELRSELKHYSYALAFKFNISTDAIMNDFSLLKKTHEAASSIELFSKAKGFARSRGFAGGSCKKLFCGSYDTCAVLSEKKLCRFPDQARPSMSGVGINFSELCAAAGWELEKQNGSLYGGFIVGLTLIG